MQLHVNLVRELVALVFDLFDVADPLIHLAIVIERVLQKLSAFDQKTCHFGEHPLKSVFAGQQIEHSPSVYEETK